nr:SGNH hydrolase domain-containing protein [Marinobacter sp. BGYM27]
MAKVNEAFTPKQLPIEYRRYADPATICHGKIVGDCLQGDLSSDREVLVLGDSHAAMLNHYFDYLGKRLGFRARVITASSCVTIPGFDFLRLPAWAQQSCIDQVGEAHNHIDDASIVFIAGMWSYQVQSEKFLSALDAFLGKMEVKGMPTYLIPQVVLLDRSPLRARRFKSIGLQRGVGADNASELANVVVSHLAERHEHVKMLKLNTENLFSHVPFFRQELIYFDQGHLNKRGAALYGEMSYSSILEVVEMDFKKE